MIHQLSNLPINQINHHKMLARKAPTTKWHSIYLYIYINKKTIYRSIYLANYLSFSGISLSLNVLAFTFLMPPGNLLVRLARLACIPGWWATQSWHGFGWNWRTCFYVESYWAADSSRLFQCRPLGHHSASGGYMFSQGKYGRTYTIIYSTSLSMCQRSVHPQ